MCSASATHGLAQGKDAALKSNWWKEESDPGRISCMHITGLLLHGRTTCLARSPRVKCAGSNDLCRCRKKTV